MHAISKSESGRLRRVSRFSGGKPGEHPGLPNYQLASVLALLLACGCGDSGSGGNTTENTGGQVASDAGGSTSTGGTGPASTKNVGGKAPGASSGGHTGAVAGNNNSSGGNGAGGLANNVGGSGNVAGSGNAGGKSSTGVGTMTDFSQACKDCLVDPSCDLGPTKAEALSWFPPCNWLTGNDGATGIPNKKLCEDLTACIQNSGCFDTVAVSATNCYCGTATAAQCQDSRTANGPCKNEFILAAGSPVDPSATIFNTMTDVNAGALGPAINEFSFVQRQCGSKNCEKECWSFYGNVAPYTGTGGTPSVGGASSVGGATGAGGVTGAGGSSGMGGVTSLGGATNTGGSVSNPCDVQGGTLLYKFDPEAGDASVSTSLADFTLVTGNVDVNQSTLTLDNSMGDPDPGSAKLYVPFDGKRDDGAPGTEGAYLNIKLEQVLNLSGKSLFACIRLDDGFFSTEAACGRMALSWHDNQGKWSSEVTGDFENLCVSDKGKWLMLDLPVAVPQVEQPDPTRFPYPPDPSNVTSAKVIISTACPISGLWGNVCAAGPSYASSAAPATFHIDSIGYR